MKDCHIHMNSMVYQSAIVLLAGLLPSFGALTVDSTVSHNCVFLQNAMNVVKGTTTAGRTVTVSFKGQQASTAADASGAFAVKFNPGAAESTPQTVTVSDGVDSQTVANVLVGEVWYLSGQSNIEFTMDYKEYAGRYNEWMKDVNYPNIRMMTAPAEATKPLEWKVCNAANVPKMSATGFFFGKKLHQAKKVPVGIVVAALGNTVISQWMSAEAIAAARAADPSIPDNAYAFYPSKCDTERAKRLDHVATRAALWYQGEGDSEYGEIFMLYEPNLRALISDWRTRRGYPDFPVVIVGLPRCAVARNIGEEKCLASVRLAQERVAASTPHVVCVPTIDLGYNALKGDAMSWHPDDKPELCYRLLLAARNAVYGESSVRYRCPYPTSATFNADKTKVIVTFPNSVSLHWKSGTKPSVVEGRESFRIRCAWSGKNYLIPDIGSNGYTLEFPAKVRTYASIVDYCSAKSENPDIQLFDSYGFPVPPFAIDVTQKGAAK